MLAHKEDATTNLPCLLSLLTANDEPDLVNDDTGLDIGSKAQPLTPVQNPKPLQDTHFCAPNASFDVHNDAYLMVDGDFEFVYREEVC